MYNIYVKTIADNTTTTGNNHKELYDSKWDPITLTKNTHRHLRFYKYFDTMMACLGRNWSPLFELINYKAVFFDEVYILFNFNIRVALLRTTMKETPCI